MSPGVIEAYEHDLKKDVPLPLFLAEKEAGAKPEWTFNMLLKHGVPQLKTSVLEGDVGLAI